MKIYFPKLYRFDRREEPCQVGIPFPPNCFREGMRLKIMDGERELPVQTRVLSRHQDGSVRFLQARFIADLPGMGEVEQFLRIVEQGEENENDLQRAYAMLKLTLGKTE